MRRTALLTRTLAALLVGALLASAGAGIALADDGTSGDGTVTAEGASDITVDGFEVAFEDVHLTGEGLPEIDVDERTFTIEERTVTVEGASIRVGDGSIELDDLTVTITDSTVTLRDVQVGEA